MKMIRHNHKATDKDIRVMKGIAAKFVIEENANWRETHCVVNHLSKVMRLVLGAYGHEIVPVVIVEPSSPG